MKILLLCLALSLAPFPSILARSPHSQSKHKPSASRQQELDEKLMNALTFGNGDAAEVRDLLKQGASPNAANWDSNTLTALMLASQRGNEEVVKLLLDAGAKVDTKAAVVINAKGDAAEGITALSQAAYSGKASIVTLLLDHGADLYAHDGRGASVMHHARSNEIVQVLLDHGLDINDRDNEKFTLLILSAAAGGRHRPDVSFLLQHGADPNSRANDGTTPLKAAQGSMGRPEDVDALKKAGAKD